MLAGKPFETVIEAIFKAIKVRPEDKEQKEIIDRVLAWLGRLVKVEAGYTKILASKDIMLKLIIYYSFAETNKNALITLHALCNKPNFKEVCYDTHGFTANSFDVMATAAKENFQKYCDAAAWDDYVNCCASLTAFVGAFPERAHEFKELIVPLIRVCSDKTDRVRKNSAVLLAKLAQDEDNKRIMQANHGTEVLYSLQNSLF